MLWRMEVVGEGSRPCCCCCCCWTACTADRRWRGMWQVPEEEEEGEAAEGEGRGGGGGRGGRGGRQYHRCSRGGAWCGVPR